MIQALIAETMAEPHCGIDEYGVAEITMQEDGKVKSKTLPVTLSGMIMIVLAVLLQIMVWSSNVWDHLS
jgi:hypothetical protein